MALVWIIIVHPVHLGVFCLPEDMIIVYADESNLLLLNHPQTLELQFRSPQTVISAMLVCGVFSVV